MSGSEGLSIHDRPNSYIGRSVPRPNLPRLLKGRGSYADDVKLPRMLHAAFLRSPYAHAEISFNKDRKGRKGSWCFEGIYR